MTPQEYIIASLQELKEVEPSEFNGNLEDEIFRLLMSKKFRKYSASAEFIEHIKKAIKLNVQKRQPINVTFLHGCYKLWRLEESPHAEWAELFAAMYYTKWLASICAIYKPGVWFDYFVDDLIIPQLNNITHDAVKEYRKSYQEVLDFLKPYQPENFCMTITGVGDQFESSKAFEKKLEKDVEKFAKNFPNGLPDVTNARAATLELNVKPTDEMKTDPNWQAKNVLVHDAYIMLTKKETGYHLQPTKILAFAQPLPIALGVGTTKTSIVRFWVGVGALKKKGESFMPYILSLNQLKENKIQKENIAIPGLTDKNFQTIRIFSE